MSIQHKAMARLAAIVLLACIALPQGLAAQGNPAAIFHTSMGQFQVELYPAKAPGTVENFINYANNGFYNGTIFHRVIGTFMIQGGGFTPDMQKKATAEPIRNEAKNGLSNDAAPLPWPVPTTPTRPPPSSSSTCRTTATSIMSARTTPVNGAPEVVAPEPQTAQPVTPLAPTEPVVLDEKAIPGEQIVVEAMPPNDIDDRPEISPVPDQSAETTPLPTLSRAQLLDAITRMEWDRSPAQTHQDSGQPPELARSTSSATLEALYRPLIAMQANEFDGMTAPSSVEVVDRWLEPGGAHRVVFRSPDGNTYCGRQEAVDDFRPWLEMPMMVHRCGGGGKRSGKQGWRNN